MLVHEDKGPADASRVSGKATAHMVQGGQVRPTEGTPPHTRFTTRGRTGVNKK